MTDASSPYADSATSPPPIPRITPANPALEFQRRMEEIRVNKGDIHSMIHDYLVLQGYNDTAKKFVSEAKIRTNKNDFDMQERVLIKRDILSGNISDAIEKVNDLNPKILDQNPKLHFSLLRLQLIELVRSSNPENESDLMNAITFANQNLAPHVGKDSTFVSDLEFAMALVVYPPSKRPTEISALLDPDMRLKTAEAVNQAILKSQDAGQASKIGELLKARQWSEQKAREMKKPVPRKLYLGIEKEESEEDDGDVVMRNGNGNGEGMGDGTTE